MLHDSLDGTRGAESRKAMETIGAREMLNDCLDENPGGRKPKGNGDAGCGASWVDARGGGTRGAESRKAMETWEAKKGDGKHGYGTRGAESRKAMETYGKRLRNADCGMRITEHTEG